MQVSCVIVAGFVAAAVLGCQRDKAEPVADLRRSRCSTTYRTKGKALVGDVDADGAGDRVTLRLDAKRPARCRHLRRRAARGRQDRRRDGAAPRLARRQPAAPAPRRDRWPARARAGDHALSGERLPAGNGLHAEPRRAAADAAGAGDRARALPALRRVPGRGGLRRAARDDRRHAQPDRRREATGSGTSPAPSTGPRQKLASPSFEPSGSWSMSATRPLRRWPEVRGDPFLRCPSRAG